MRHAVANPIPARGTRSAPLAGSVRVRGLLRWYWSGVLVLLAGVLALTFWFTPVHEQMGPSQKIFYFHLGVAIGTFLACAVAFVAGIGYLWQRDAKWDALSDSAARAAIVLCTVVLLTGMIWAKQAWGVWWEWSTPLTFSLILWVIYLGYPMTRRWLVSPERRPVVCAVYGVVAFLDVPLVYVSVKLLPEQHPTSMELSGPMRLTLITWLAVMALVAGGLIATRYVLARSVARSEPGG